MSEPTAVFDTIVVGSGVAGLTAGMYAARYQLKTAIIGKELGGETTTAWTIHNFPGFKQVDGAELVQKMNEQTEASGVVITDDEVTQISRQGHCFTVVAGQDRYVARTIILADGTLRRHLGLQNEHELVGKGVHYCATCDAPLYKDKTIAIAGGGDAAVKGANLAKQYCRQVYLVVRGDQLRGEPVNIEALKGAPNVKILYGSQVKEILGGDWLEKISISDRTDKLQDLAIDGLFIEIGADPNSALAKQLGCQIDETGYVKVGSMTETSIDGVFAAGDNTNFFGSFKQDITAAALGAVAATAAYRDILEHKPVCEPVLAEARSQQLESPPVNQGT